MLDLCSLLLSRFSKANLCWLVVLAGCGGTHDALETQTIYDSEEGPVKGWSHIVSDPDAFPLIASEVEHYAVDERSMERDAELGGAQVFRTTLVRKLSDWGRQHANGLEPLFVESPIRVGDLHSVHVTLKVHSEGSVIPDPAQLREHYGAHLSQDQIDALDEGVACLGFTFVEAGYNDQSSESLNAFYFVSFDPETDLNQWGELEILLEDFTFGFEKNYSLREVERDEVLDREFVGFRINPEGTGGKVARNFLNESWDGSVPELYKETSISLRRIEVLKTNGEE
ncbi:hypothetical protein [Pelagicoccus mobilis]|nr:hypothetical protein [Pelagicoccus mobilis]